MLRGSGKTTSMITPVQQKRQTLEHVARLRDYLSENYNKILCWQLTVAK
jgi:hypothetical protein